MHIQNVLSIGSAMLENVLFSGIVFGWPTLQYLLEDKGYFRDVCPDGASNSTNITQVAPPSSCGEQKARFNLVFTLSSNMMLLVSFLFGFLLDRFGTWIFRSIVSVIFTLGYIFVVISSPSSSNFLFPGMIFLGVAGIGLLLSNIQLVQLSPRAHGIVSTLINGMFDSAPLVFLIVKKLHDAGVSLTSIFQALTCLTILPWIKTFVLMPKKTVPYPVPPKYEYGWKELVCFKTKNGQVQERYNGDIDSFECDDSCKSPYSIDRKEEEKHATPVTFKDCLRNKLFWTNCFHFAVITFRVNFFLGVLINWLQTFEKGGVGSFAETLGVMLLFSGLVGPLNGAIIDAVVSFNRPHIKDDRLLNTLGLSASMLATSLLSIALSIMVLIPSVYASYAIFIFLKTFIYGGSSTLIILLFPPEHLGKLFGLNNIIAGSVGLLQFALFQLALYADPTFNYIHIGFCVLTILTLVHPVMLYRESKKSNLIKQ